MRIAHLVFVVAVAAVILAIARDDVGRVALIVFFTGLGEVVVGTAALLALFQTLGAFGEAKGPYAHAEALVATTMVLVAATALMSACLFVGAWLVQVTVV